MFPSSLFPRKPILGCPSLACLTFLQEIPRCIAVEFCSGKKNICSEEHNRLDGKIWSELLELKMLKITDKKSVTIDRKHETEEQKLSYKSYLVSSNREKKIAKVEPTEQGNHSSMEEIVIRMKRQPSYKKDGRWQTASEAEVGQTQSTSFNQNSRGILWRSGFNLRRRKVSSPLSL